MKNLTLKIGPKYLCYKDIFKYLKTIKKETYIICSSINDFDEPIDNEYCHFLFIDADNISTTEEMINQLKKEINNVFSKDIFIYDLSLFNINYESQVKQLTHFLNKFQDIYIQIIPMSENYTFPFNMFFTLEKIDRLLFQYLEEGKNTYIHFYHKNSRINFYNYKYKNNFNYLVFVLENDDSSIIDDILRRLQYKEDIYESLNRKYPHIFTSSLFKSNDFIIFTKNKDLLNNNSMSVSTETTPFKLLMEYLQNYPNIYIEDMSFLYNKKEKELKQFFTIINTQNEKYKNIFLHININNKKSEELVNYINLNKKSFYTIQYQK